MDSVNERLNKAKAEVELLEDELLMDKILKEDISEITVIIKTQNNSETKVFRSALLSGNFLLKLYDKDIAKPRIRKPMKPPTEWSNY